MNFQFHQGLSMDHLWTYWTMRSSLSIPSRIICEELTIHSLYYVCLSIPSRIIKGRKKVYLWKRPRTFNSIKDYRLCSIFLYGAYNSISFNSIKDYQAEKKEEREKKGLGFQFHQGLSRDNPNPS